MAFGDFAQFINALAHFSTTSAVYVTKTGATFTTPLLPAGDYIVGHSGTWQNEDAATDAQIQILINAIQVFESERYLENEPDNAETDSHEGFNHEGRFSIVVPTILTLSTQVRIVGTAGNEVSLDDVVLFIYALDVATLFFNTFFGDGFATSSQSYQLVASTAVLSLPAGNYRIYVRADYRNETSAKDAGIRFRERRDPVGANVITILHGDDASGADEAIYSNTGRGDDSGDPYLQFGWVTACRELVADDYQFELHARTISGGPNDINLDKFLIFVEQLS